jgi:HAD superfamily hydrolase (TIGR01509 family)
MESVILDHMNWLNNWDLVLLDMDGLLVDSEPLHFTSYQQALKHYGVELEWDYSTYCRYAHESSARLKQELQRLHPCLTPWEEVYETKRQAYYRLLEQTPVNLMPGVDRLLRALQGKRHCVVTHSRPYEVGLIRRYQPLIDAIPHWITREQYSQPKPHPEGYLLACERLGKPGDRVIGFEDSPRGLIALRAAKVAPVWVVPLDSHPDPWEGVVRYHSFESIPESGPIFIPS